MTITLAWPDKVGLCSIEGCAKPTVGQGLCNAHYKRFRRHGSPLGGRTPVGDPDRFIREIALRYEGDDCLAWPFNRGGGGYALAWHDGTTTGAYRLVCEAHHGPAPSALHEAAHTCGKGHEGCVNPHHLEWKTRSENHADKVLHGTHNCGERNPFAKVTTADAAHIRAMRGKVSGRQLARQFGISPATVCNIQKGDTWAWMP